MAGLAAQAPLRAQSPPPPPAVAVAQLPSFLSSIRTGDLNGDGRLDLIGTAAGGDLRVALGRGDGTFRSPTSLVMSAKALVLGDFNTDGALDAVVFAGGVLSILPGRGDGTFRVARTIATGVQPNLENLVTPSPAAVDFNGDGKLDLATFDGSHIVIFPGRGDFSFDTRVDLQVTEGATTFIAVDLNNDGALDIAATAVVTQTVEIFINRGALTFTASTVPVATIMQDIAAADFNEDGRQDLVLTNTFDTFEGFTDGRFHVLLGRGDGTFQPPVEYPTGVRGALTLALGDFNRDGNVDVATGNRSAFFLDTSCTGLVYWDSVTIAPGTGSGTFGQPFTFRLGSSTTSDRNYQMSHSLLRAGDLNGDGATDLVATPGAILLSRAPVANRAPRVSAGPDATIAPNDNTMFDSSASDADNDWLDFVWRDAAGNQVRAVPVFCQGIGPGTYTLTVTDRHGGTASDSMQVVAPLPEGASLFLDARSLGDSLGTETPFLITWGQQNLTGVSTFRVQSSSDDGKTWTTIPGCGSLPPSADRCLWNQPGPVTENGRIQVEALNSSGGRIAFSASPRFRIVAGPRTTLPPGWFQSGIGPVGADGSATFDGTTFTVKGAGTDIWNTADEFHWAFTFASGDFDAVARVTSVENVNRWTKAGLMLRPAVGPGSRHASVFVTPTTEKGIAFQRRVTDNGTSVTTPGPAITAPVWLRLARRGNTVSAYYRVSAGDAWTLIGSQTFAALDNSLLVGLAVSSHVHATLATAKFDNVRVGARVLPPGWNDEDVGSVGAEGRAEVTGSAVITGSGADIWGTADEFHWAYRPVAGDFSIEALVDSVENVDRWTKAGLMIRTTSAPTSRHASLFATPTAEKGISFQGRTSHGGVSTEVKRLPVAPSVWLRLTRRGPNINAYYRKTSLDAWQHLGQIVLPGLAPTVLVGLAVTSHVDGVLATGNFSQIAIEPVLAWTTARVGPGSSNSFVDGTFFSAENRGADIWGTSDAFTYIYTKWSGDGALMARLTGLDFAHEWTKGGLMFRDSLAPGARYAFNLASAGRGLALQYRSPGDTPAVTAASVPGVNAPGEVDTGLWLLLVREGDLFRAYYSTDRISFQFMGSVTISMPEEVFVGLAVTSHNVDAAAWGRFQEVTVRHHPFELLPAPMQ